MNRYRAWTFLMDSVLGGVDRIDDVIKAYKRDTRERVYGFIDNLCYYFEDIIEKRKMNTRKGLRERNEWLRVENEGLRSIGYSRDKQIMELMNEIDMLKNPKMPNKESPLTSFTSPIRNAILELEVK